MDAAEPTWSADFRRRRIPAYRELAEELLRKYRFGETPDLEEYCRRYPELAGRIRELFPALILMEETCGTPGPSLVQVSLTEANGFGGQIGDYRITRLIAAGNEPRVRGGTPAPGPEGGLEGAAGSPGGRCPGQRPLPA